MKKTERFKAIAFLTTYCGGPNLKNQQTALRKLADGTKLTRQRIHQIVKNSQNSLSSLYANLLGFGYFIGFTLKIVSLNINSLQVIGIC